MKELSPEVYDIFSNQKVRKNRMNLFFFMLVVWRKRGGSGWASSPWSILHVRTRTGAKGR